MSRNGREVPDCNMTGQGGDKPRQADVSELSALFEWNGDILHGGSGANQPSGVLLVLPTLESGLDPHEHHKIHHACSLDAIAALGRPVCLADPSEPETFRQLISSDIYSVVIAVRSQSQFWPLPDPSTREYQIAVEKTLVTFAGNPPFYEGSFGFHKAAFKRKITILADLDALEYAQSVNLSGSRFVAIPPCSHDVDLHDEAEWLQPSRRKIPILFIGSFSDPETHREAWRRTFANFPGPLAAIEGAADLLAACPALPVWRAATQAAGSLGIAFDLRSRAGRTALELLSRYSNNRTRQAVLEQVSRYPSTIVADQLPAFRSPHRDCVLIGSTSFRTFLQMLKQTACLISTNPNAMTGAIGERVPNAMRRGAVVVHAPNNTLRTFAGAGIVVLRDDMSDLDDRLEAAAMRDSGLDEHGEAARSYAAAHLRMDQMYERILRVADDPGAS